MKVIPFLTFVWMLGIMCSISEGGVKPMTAARWSSKVLKAGKLGKLGEMSLKSTLGALSMVGSLVLFSAIEASIEPDNVIGHKWLKAQKQQ